MQKVSSKKKQRPAQKQDVQQVMYPLAAGRKSISSGVFEKLAILLTKFTGGTTAFILAMAIVIIWGFTGPLFNFSETWQLVINTGTTIITFLMVFLIQRTQNKDSLAIQLKLNEIIASI